LRILPKKDTSNYKFLFTETPVVDSIPQSRFFNHTGNISAFLEEGAGGFILAEKKFSEEEKWYFVVMNLNRGAIQHVFCGTGDNGSYRYSVIGWINASEIEKLDYTLPGMSTIDLF